MAVVPIIKKFHTNDFFLGNERKIRRVGLNLEVHYTGRKVVHIKAIDNLIMLVVAGRSNVYDFPVNGTWEFGKALESYIELE